jgi:hypothetical protein
MRSSSNVRINAGLGEWITKKLTALTDAVRDLIGKNYQAYTPRSTSAVAASRNLSSLFGHKYAYYEAKGISYSAAAAACRAKGGHLITVTSPMEYSYLSGTLSAGKSGAYWVGASGGPGNWSWCTGESTSYARTITAHDYSMDTCGSYFGGLGNCLVYYPGLAYPTRNRPSVSGVNGYICEWEPGAAITDADAGIFSAVLCRYGLAASDAGVAGMDLIIPEINRLCTDEGILLCTPQRMVQQLVCVRVLAGAAGDTQQ